MVRCEGTVLSLHCNTDKTLIKPIITSLIFTFPSCRLFHLTFPSTYAHLYSSSSNLSTYPLSLSLSSSSLNLLSSSIASLLYPRPPPSPHTQTHTHGLSLLQASAVWHSILLSCLSLFAVCVYYCLLLFASRLPPVMRAAASPLYLCVLT